MLLSKTIGQKKGEKSFIYEIRKLFLTVVVLTTCQVLKDSHTQ